MGWLKKIWSRLTGEKAEMATYMFPPEQPLDNESAIVDRDKKQ